MAKKPMYSFAEKTHSGKGITATVLGGLSLLMFLAMVYISFCMGGNAGIYAGGIGLAAGLLAFVGLIFGFISLLEKHSLSLFPKLGSLLCGIVFIVWLGLFLSGIGK